MFRASVGLPGAARSVGDSKSGALWKRRLRDTSVEFCNWKSASSMPSKVQVRVPQFVALAVYVPTEVLFSATDLLLDPDSDSAHGGVGTGSVTAPLWCRACP